MLNLVYYNLFSRLNNNFFLDIAVILQRNLKIIFVLIVEKDRRYSGKKFKHT